MNKEFISKILLNKKDNMEINLYLSHVTDKLYMSTTGILFLKLDNKFRLLTEEEKDIYEMVYSEEISMYRNFFKIMSMPIEHTEGTLVRTIRVELPYCKDIQEEYEKYGGKHYE